jgi:hypothetical protein
MLNKFEDLPKLMLEMLKSKETVVKTILKDIEESNKMHEGLKKCCDSVINNPSDKNLRKMVNTTMKCVSSQSSIITKLCFVALTYCGGNSYDGDVAMIINKLGHGKEALREMFRQKMKRV